MKPKLSKPEAQAKIEEFFKKDTFTPKQLKKIKRLAMKFKIKLKSYRKKFCKSCLSQLKGKARITKTHKSIICQICGYKNKFRLA